MIVQLIASCALRNRKIQIQTVLCYIRLGFPFQLILYKWLFIKIFLKIYPSAIWSCEKKAWWQRGERKHRKKEKDAWKAFLERGGEMILPLLCSFICCLPFNWISHLRVWLWPGSEPAYPLHNNQFSPHTAPRPTEWAAYFYCLGCDAFQTFYHSLFPDFNSSAEPNSKQFL